MLFLFHVRFHLSQLVGAALVVSGVVFSVLPLNPSAAALNPSIVPDIELKYVCLVVACFSLPALASTLKDKIFRQEQARLGRPLDIFVVNSFGSIFQVCVCAYVLK
jgi:drug/metabolite transporter (DMT)-like permease